MNVSDYGVHVAHHPERFMDSPSPEALEMEMDMARLGEAGAVVATLEVWDYVGGNRFRGFVADRDGERAMFIFFDPTVIGAELKTGYVS